MADCLFCRIISGEVPSKKVFEDEHTYAFEDLNPQGPTHVLVIPKKHIAGLKEAKGEDAELVGRCHLTAARIARERSIGRWLSHRSQRRSTRGTIGFSSARSFDRRTLTAVASGIASFRDPRIRHQRQLRSR